MKSINPNLTHLILFVIFTIITSVFFSPVFEGKSLKQSDIQNLGGAGREVLEFEKENETISWTNVHFSGMPLIGNNPTSIYKQISTALGKLINREILILLFLYLGFYFSSVALGSPSLLAFVGSLSFALSTFNIIGIEVGHVNKIYSVAFMAPIIIGVINFYRNRYVSGLFLILIGLGFQLVYNHLQITYYTLIGILIYQIIAGYFAIKEKQFLPFLKKTALLGLIATIVILTQVEVLWSTWNYQKASNRGGSELVSKESAKTSSGLDKEYAFAWSNGIAEPLTMLFPYFQGGASQEALSTKSLVYKELTKKGVKKSEAKRFIKGIPTYWGTQPFVAGPYYFGVIIVFFFVLGLFGKKSKIKTWSIVVVTLSLILSMGSNVAWFNYLFFDYFPLYNKFRTVTMITILFEIAITIFGIIAIAKFIEIKDKDQAKKQLIYATSALAGFCLILALLPTVFFDFQSERDAAYGLPDWLIAAIKDERVSFFRTDAFKAIGMILIAATCLYFIIQDKLKIVYGFSIIALVLLADLWSVNKRYLDDADFVKVKKTKDLYLRPAPQAHDLQILKDTDPYFRVFNTTTSPTNDGGTSNYHYAIGGYSAIKLQRYQDLIERHISKGNMSVLNMLNAKYFIVRKKESNQVVAQRNPKALGNAWFVNDYKLVESANEEIEALNDINTANTAVVNTTFQQEIAELGTTSMNDGDITLTKYHPDQMTYKANTDESRLAVFSDIYYQPGWKAFIDEKPVEHIRVNYLLRGLVVPSGSHEIVFKFNPPSKVIGRKVAFAASILVFAILLVLILFRNKAESILKQTLT